MYSAQFSWLLLVWNNTQKFINFVHNNHCVTSRKYKFMKYNLNRSVYIFRAINSNKNSKEYYIRVYTYSYSYTRRLLRNWWILSVWNQNWETMWNLLLVQTQTLPLTQSCISPPCQNIWFLDFITIISPHYTLTVAHPKLTYMEKPVITIHYTLYSFKIDKFLFVPRCYKFLNLAPIKISICHCT